ncbi:MAG: hypothetical protein KAR33_03180 [Candidatus Thorarchaeota archaeon]|nr:hypothetical protein [Candidatus Thorarchaeota archaeon]
MIQHSRTLLIGVIITLLVISIIPIGVYYSNHWDQTTTDLEGVPIETTVFASYLGDNGSSLVFPDAYQSTTMRPLVLMSDYSEFAEREMIGYDDALEIAEDWLFRIGPSLIEWSLWYHFTSTTPPSRTFFFTHIDFLAFVVVDSLSGSVIEYESKYLHDYDPTVLDLQEAENLTMSFLESENIILPTTARYIAGEPYDCQRFYSLVFQEYSGLVKVDGSQVLVRTSAFTRGISYYKYSWLGISNLDLSGILSPEVAQQNVLLQFSELSTIVEPVWLGSELTLVEITSASDSNSTSWRLAWVFDLGDNEDDEYDAEIMVDAYSGNMFGFRDSYNSFKLVVEQTTLWSTEFLVGLGGTSFLTVLVVAMYFLSKSTSDN